MATTYGALKALITAAGGLDTDLLSDQFSVKNSEPPIVTRRLLSDGTTYVIEVRS